MARHTTFRFCLDPTVEQTVALARHLGAARFAYNQSLRLHLDARERHRALSSRGAGADGTGQARDGVPWSGFSLINALNSWKRSEAAGRRFLVTGDGVAEVEVTGLAWRGEVSSQVLEEGAVDVGRGLAAWTASRSGKRTGRPVGHPRFKKNHTGGSFRMRNKTTGGRASIRVGTVDRPRSVTLPRIGSIRVREDTRRLRRMIANGRARILQATITVSNQLVKSHDRLVLEDLNITGIMANRRLARAVGDAGWGELARQVTYKQHWRSGRVVVADRWLPSSKTCSGCGHLKPDLTLSDRTYTCDRCGLVLDRDLNAAANLAAWAEDHTLTVENGAGRGEARDGDRQAAGPVIKACRRDGTGPHTRVGETSPDDAGTPVQAAPAA